MVRSRRLELPRPLGHSDLNAARLPVPPRPHVTAPRKIAPGPVGAGPLAKGRERGNARAWRPAGLPFERGAPTPLPRKAGEELVAYPFLFPFAGSGRITLASAICATLRPI